MESNVSTNFIYSAKGGRQKFSAGLIFLGGGVGPGCSAGGRKGKDGLEQRGRAAPARDGPPQATRMRRERAFSESVINRISDPFQMTRLWPVLTKISPLFPRRLFWNSLVS